MSFFDTARVNANNLLLLQWIAGGSSCDGAQGAGEAQGPGGQGDGESESQDQSENENLLGREEPQANETQASSGDAERVGN